LAAAVDEPAGRRRPGICSHPPTVTPTSPCWRPPRPRGRYLVLCEPGP
jgi:hypothetical protein